MNFFEAQEEAHHRTKWLGVGFLFCVLGVMLSVGGLMVLITHKTGLRPTVEAYTLEIFLTSSIISGLTILIPYAYKATQLSRGGDVVALDLGGRLLDGDPSDFHEKRLLNIVEEMALASSVPVPMVYVMDQENSINAFAAGTEPTNAVIGVTKGCIEHLSREELQGVIAHEFSHILNGDMKMNMRIIGWGFGLMAISMIGQLLFRSLSYSRISTRRSRDNDAGGNLAIILITLGIGLMLIGGIGVFFGRLLQSAISRQREYLADASAVQFTRNPDSIAGALMKIGGLGNRSKMRSPKTGEASHMFFSDGGMFSFGFATHPPLDVRIRRLKKEWDGEFQTSDIAPLQSEMNNPVSQLTSSQQQYTAPQPESLDIQHTIAGVSEPFLAAAHNPTECQLLIFALLVSSEGGLNGQEASRLREISQDEQTDALVLKWAKETESLHSVQKISLIDLAIPTLRRLSMPSKRRFIKTTRALIAADREVSLFEYMLQRIVERHLLRHSEGASFSRVKYYRLEQISESVELLSQTMTKFGSQDFDLNKSEIEALDKTLNTCEMASPKVKNQLLHHIKQLALKDGKLTNKETELLRTVADAIGCVLKWDTLETTP